MELRVDKDYLEKKKPADEQTLFLDENDRVYRINEYGEKTIVVSFESIEIEKSIKLELFMKKHFERIKAWHNKKGMETPPIAWDEKACKYVWLNRKARRA